jgi:hypothetical protein
MRGGHPDKPFTYVIEGKVCSPDEVDEIAFNP